MITKTFICDLCKKSVGETELFGIEVNINVPGKSGYGGRYVTQKKEVCKECLEKKGIVTEATGDRAKDQQNGTANQKTLEQKMIDILEDLGVQFTE